MKLWHNIFILAALVAIGSCGWYHFPSDRRNVSDKDGKVLR